MRPFFRWIALLCVLLIVGSAVAFAAHHHLDDWSGAESAKCSVCVAAHSTSITAPTLSPTTVAIVISTINAAPDAGAKQRLIAFALAVRPPPES